MVLPAYRMPVSIKATAVMKLYSLHIFKYNNNYFE